MLRKSLSFALTLLLLAPVNAGAAAWMAMPMIDGETSVAIVDEHLNHETVVAHGSHNSYSSHSVNMKGGECSHSPDAEGHDKEGCEEHCMSCSNHCSSLAVPTYHTDTSNQVRLLSAVAAGMTSNHPDILLRPPIHS